MAEKIRGITVEIGGDTSGLDKSLKNVNKEIKSTQAELKDVEKLLKLDPANTELLAQKQQLLADRVSETSEKLEVLHKAEQELRDAGVDENSSQFKALQREIISTENYLADAKKEADNFSVALTKASVNAKDLSDKAKSVADATKGISTVAGGFLTGLAGASYKAVTLSDDLNTLAKQTGLSTAEIQKMNYAQDVIDVSTDQMIASIKKLTNTLKSSEKKFESLGVKTRNANGEFRDATEIWYDTLEALSKVENETERDTLAMDIFGKSASDLAGIVDDGGQALRELGENAEQAGLILSQDTLDSLNAVNDQIDTIKATATATIATTGAKALETLAPVIDIIVTKIGELLTWIGNLDSDQLKLIITIAGVVASISPIASIISGISGAVSGFLGFMPQVVAVATKIFEFAMNNPIVLIAGAVTALVALVIANWDKIKPVLEAIWTKIKTICENIANKVKSVMDTIKTTVKSVINGVIGIVNGLINGINLLIGGLNRLKFEAPKWVPVIGGKSFGINIPYIGNIPMLANGGVMSQGSAIVGDAGPELLTMNQGRAIVQPLTPAMQTAGDLNITVQSVLDGRIIGESTTTFSRNQDRRFGR